jgi:hypothetical protein
MHVQLTIVFVFVHTAPTAAEAVAVADDPAHFMPVFTIIMHTATLPKVMPLPAYPFIHALIATVLAFIL